MNTTPPAGSTPATHSPSASPAPNDAGLLRRRMRAAVGIIPAVALGLTAALMGAPAHAAPVSPASTVTVTASGTSESAVEDAVGDDQALERGAAQAEIAETTDTGFYDSPATIPTTPGTLIRSEKTEFYLDPIKLIKYPATATKVLYSSTNRAGEPTVVSGTVLTPTKAWTGKGTRPVIAYAPGTQGIGDHCAPSRTLSVGMQYEGIGVSDLLNAGYAVVMTDYAGLGTEGIHTYLVREDQGHAVLDSVRAAAQVPGTQVTPDSRIALAGYSQGGGASAAAAELAGSYAPELDVQGAYVGAAPADLTAVGQNIDGTLYSEFLLYGIAGLMEAYSLDPATVLNEAGMVKHAEAQENCTIDGVLKHSFIKSAGLTHTGETFAQTMTSDPQMKAMVQEQSLGTAGNAPDFPVMVASSLTDDVIPYTLSRTLAQQWCKQGTKVRFDTILTPTHLGGYVAGLPRMQSYLWATFNNVDTLNACWRL